MRRLCRHCLLAAALALAAVVLAGCGALSGVSGHGLVLYNGQHIQTTDSLVAAFEKQTGISVAVRSDDEDTLADEILTEGPNSPADVIYTENSPALEYLASRGLLARVDPSTLGHTPRRFNSPQSDWVGVSARVSVLIYNPSLISRSQLPTSVMQLADARYRGKLAFAAGETDFQPIVTSVARTYGQAAALRWLEGIKGNAGGHVYPDNETISAEVNRGAVAFGVINQYYWYRLRAEIGATNIHSRLAYFAPQDPGYVLDVSGAGDPQVVQAQGRGAEVSRVPRLAPGAGDHRPLDQLRVPDRLGRHDRRARDAVRQAAAELDHDPASSATDRARSRCSARRGCCEHVGPRLRRRPSSPRRTGRARTAVAAAAAAVATARRQRWSS